MNTQKNLGVLTRGFTQLAIKSCGSEQGRRIRGQGGTIHLPPPPILTIAAPISIRWGRLCPTHY